MTRLPLAILLAAVLGLSGCAEDSDHGSAHRVAARDAVNPCKLAASDQQVATSLTPTSREVKRARLDGLLGAGLAADGVCFDVFYDLVGPGWAVTDFRVTASQDGVTYAQTVPDRVYRTQFDPRTKMSTRPLPGLYVPLRGCVDVTGTVDLVGPHGAHGTYAATATYGRGCARYTLGPSNGS